MILILGILSACGGSRSQTESGELIIAVESSAAEVADAEDSAEDSVGEVVIIEEAEENSAAEDVISEEEGLNSEEEKKHTQSNNPFTFTTIEEGKLHMATEPFFPPYTAINDSGELEGIDVEIAEAIVGGITDKNVKIERNTVFAVLPSVTENGMSALFGCSEPTAQRIKSSGEIDDAISQINGIIVVDAEYALDLLRVSKKYRNTSLKKPKK